MSIDSEFQTSDLGLAAFLLARDFVLLGISDTGNRRRVFRFPAAAHAVAQGYYQNVQVPARTFFNAVRDLKAQVRGF